jgi:hypothetical protein
MEQIVRTILDLITQGVMFVVGYLEAGSKWAFGQINTVLNSSAWSSTTFFYAKPIILTIVLLVIAAGVVYLYMRYKGMIWSALQSLINIIYVVFGVYVAIIAAGVLCWIALFATGKF